MLRTRPVRWRIAGALGLTLGLVASGVATAGPPTGGALPPQLTQIIGIAGVGEVPIDAVGVALNVTVTNPARAGYVTVHPCRDPAPVASNVNYIADQTVPNFVIAGLDIDGDVCVTTNAVTDVIVDVAGYVPAGSPIVPLVEPARFLDTREGLGAPRARVGAGHVLSVPVAGRSGVPAGAGTVIFNTTVVSPSAAGFVTVFPCGQPVPATSSVNFVAGGVVPNLTIAAVGAGGSVCLYTTAETDLVADVAAYVPAGATGLTMLASPQRILDTRIGLGGPAAPLANDVRPVQVGGVSGVPAGATAALVNLTATEAADAGFAAAFPCGVGVPLVSNLNYGRGQNVANAAVVKLAADGTMCLTANKVMHAVVDVAGYVTGASALVPVTPRRLLDSREGVEPRCQQGIDVLTDLSSSPPMQTFHRYDLVSGGRQPDLQGLPAMPATNVFVMSDCTTVVMGLADSIGPQIWRFAVDGSLVENRRLTGFLPGSNVVASDREIFALGFFNRVIRADTGQALFPLPDLGVANGGAVRSWRLIGASDDGSVVALSAVGPDVTRGLQYDVYLFTTDGTLVDLVSLPVGGWPIAVSPDLAYVLFFVRDGRGGIYEVVTFAAESVATFPESEGSWTQFARGFATSGAVNVCRIPSTANTPVPGTALRWGYFTPFRPWTASNLPCLDEVG